MATKTVFIQTEGANGADGPKGWWSDGCYEAALGFKALGYKLKGFDSRKMDELPLAKSRPVRGSIWAVKRALTLLGCPIPGYHDIPDSLKPFAGREIWASTLGEVRKNMNKVFIKPLKNQKDFKGHIWDIFAPYGAETDGYYRAQDLPAKYPVLCQEPVLFRSEWRAYILRGEILGVCHYDGSWQTRPSRGSIQKMIAAFGKEAPVGYAMDVGYIQGRKEPVLVEINDSCSFGNYNLSSADYARILTARWKEMVSGR